MSSKLREALEKSRKAMDEMSKSIFQGWIEDGLVDVMGEAQRAISSALAEPIRNCDVGTAEEQYQRWDKYCNSLGIQCDKCDLNCNVRFNLTAKCFACWSQMPYQKEGEE